MQQEKTGQLIAKLRKEKGLTQEKLAERLGVNSRSVSRWENGRCMPDLSLLQELSAELGITVTELLEGEQGTGGAEKDWNKELKLILKAAQREYSGKIRRVNALYGTGLFCLAAAVLQYQFGLFSPFFAPDKKVWAGAAFAVSGLIFGLAGLGAGRRAAEASDEGRWERVLKGRKMNMTTAQEMMDYVKREQDIQERTYRKVFEAIACELQEGEHICEIAVGSEYVYNNFPVMWYAGLVVTEERILLGGQKWKGMWILRYPVESWQLENFISVTTEFSGMGTYLVMNMEGRELRIKMKGAREAEKLCGQIRDLVCKKQGKE